MQTQGAAVAVAAVAVAQGAAKLSRCCTVPGYVCRLTILDADKEPVLTKGMSFAVCCASKLVQCAASQHISPSAQHCSTATSLPPCSASSSHSRPWHTPATLTLRQSLPQRRHWLHVCWGRLQVCSQQAASSAAKPDRSNFMMQLV
jgi:hypothetical protein